MSIARQHRCECKPDSDKLCKFCRWVADHTELKEKITIKREQRPKKIYPDREVKLAKTCVYRLPQVGYLNCGCQGKPALYQCSALQRPYNGLEQRPAYCVDRLPVKRLGALKMDQTTELDRLEYHEVMECGKRCDLYQVRIADNGTTKDDQPSAG